MSAPFKIIQKLLGISILFDNTDRRQRGIFNLVTEHLVLKVINRLIQNFATRILTKILKSLLDLRPCLRAQLLKKDAL
jgi:hypothetical protein